MHGMPDDSDGFKEQIPPCFYRRGGIDLTTERRHSKPPNVTTLLLVEDDLAVRDSLRMGLETQPNFEILEAGGSDEALAICQSYKGTIDVFVIDVVLPSIWGNELARRLALVRPGTPVVFISGHIEEMLLDHGILTGREPFMGKPFDGRVLAKKIKEILEPEMPVTRPNEGALPAGNA
jgi:DNA-binding response OmpR family regulator